MMRIFSEMRCPVHDRKDHMKEREPACRLCEEKWHSLEDQDIYEELQSAADFRAPMIAVTLQSFGVI